MTTFIPQKLQMIPLIVSVALQWQQTISLPVPVWLYWVGGAADGRSKDNKSPIKLSVVAVAGCMTVGAATGMTLG